VNEAELLFSQVLGCDRLDLYLNKDKYLSGKKLNFITNALARRIKGEPIQYILGKTEFMGLELKIGAGVFIPRPETEILVETAIKYVQGAPRLRSGQAGCRVQGKRILDLGTGSGCIAVSLAKYLTDIEIDASDISDQALAVAHDNAKLNKVSVNFFKSDLFLSSKLYAPSYDLIVSNPPYVSEGEIGKLQPELRFEPRVALSGGLDGLDFYRRIIPESADYLKSNGLLMMEIGFGQRQAIEKIFSGSGKFKVIEVVKDYNNIDRVIVARKADTHG